jgi:hypothetical protein
MPTATAPLMKLSNLKIAFGSTTPGVGWENVPNEQDGIFIQVNTSEAQFTQAPQYFFSLQGNDGGGMWSVTGTGTVYRQGADKFSVYLRWPGDANLRKEFAANNKWYISWVAIGQ